MLIWFMLSISRRYAYAIMNNERHRDQDMGSPGLWLV